MNRYWIARQDQGMIKVLPPSDEDVAKYSKKEESAPDIVIEKAGLTAKIVKRVFPEYENYMVVKVSHLFMQESTTTLKTWLDNLSNERTVQHIRRMVMRHVAHERTQRKA